MSETTTVTKEIGIDYGHTLPDHYSFCNQLHGHRARVLATVTGPIAGAENPSSRGMVFDFKILGELLKDEIHERLDHGFAVWKDDKKDLDFVLQRNTKVLVTDEPPTAEYLAKWAAEILISKLPTGITLTKLEWYETPNSHATYTPSIAKITNL